MDKSDFIIKSELEDCIIKLYDVDNRFIKEIFINELVENQFDNIMIKKENKNKYMNLNYTNFSLLISTIENLAKKVDELEKKINSYKKRGHDHCYDHHYDHHHHSKKRKIDEDEPNKSDNSDSDNDDIEI